MKDSTKLVRSWVKEGGKFDYIDKIYFYKVYQETGQDDIRIYFKRPLTHDEFNDLWQLIYSKLKETKETSFFVSFGPVKGAPYDWCTACYK